MCVLSSHQAVETDAAAAAYVQMQPGKMLYGPYADPEENLVHPATQSPLFRGANYCTSCHFDKVKDVTQKDLPGEILQGTICQDCHMEPSTGSSTSKRGADDARNRPALVPRRGHSRHLVEKSQSASRMDAAYGSGGDEVRVQR